MAVGIHRAARVIINQTALYHNIHSEYRRLPKGTRLFMVVKADGYGCGAVHVARVAKRAGASGFCVAILDEALELRRAGIMEPILVLGLTDFNDAPLAAEHNISLTVSSVHWLKLAARSLQDSAVEKRLNVHLGLDTGMGRIGFQTKDGLKQAIKVLKLDPSQLNFEGIFTHFATADSPNDRYFKLQLKRFQDLMTVVHPRPRFVHVSNSAASLWHRSCHGNLIRYGAAGYGLNPSGDVIKAPFQLKPVMTVKARLSYVKLIRAGRSIGYGATYTAKCDQWIGTVPIGYADGVRRSMKGFRVLVDGHDCQIVGQICMDQFMIRLPFRVNIGTDVTIVGQNGSHQITLLDIAKYCHTINYEVACGFTHRLPRKYVD